MIRTKNRFRLCVTLLILNLAFIWGNSLLPGELSGAFSNWIRDLLAPLFGSRPGDNTGGGLLRKIAHFTEFTSLGICLRWLFGMLRQKTAQIHLFPLLAGIAVACIDETIQAFVPERGPGIKDVGIDTLGIIFGIILLSSIHALMQTKRRKINHEKTNRNRAAIGTDSGTDGLRQTGQQQRR